MYLKIYSDKEFDDCGFISLQSMNNQELLNLLEEIMDLRIFDFIKTINYINTRLFSPDIKFIKLFCEMIEKFDFNDLSFYDFNFLKLTKEYVNQNPNLIYEFYKYSLGKYVQAQTLFGFFLFKNSTLLDEEIYSNIISENVNIQKGSIEILNLCLRNNISISISNDKLLNLEKYVHEDNYANYVDCLTLSVDDDEVFVNKITTELNSDNYVFSIKYLLNSLNNSISINENLFFKSYSVLDKHNEDKYNYFNNKLLYDVQEKLYELNRNNFLEIIYFKIDNYKPFKYDNVHLSSKDKNKILYKLNEKLRTKEYVGEYCKTHINSIFESKEDIMEWIEIHKFISDFDKIILVLLREISFNDKYYVEKVLNEIGEEKNINIQDIKKHEDPKYSLLYVIDRILYQNVYNINDLNECLELYPNTNNFVGNILRKSLKKNEYDPHPLVNFFYQTPDKIKEYDKEYIIRNQNKWELIFKTLNENEIIIKKSKIANLNTAEDVLCEMEVITSLIKNFDVELESKIIPLNSEENITNVDVLVKYKNEEVYIEIANLTLNSVTEYSQSMFVSFEEKQYKPYNVLSKKYKEQYHNGNIKNPLPLYYVLCGSSHFNFKDSIYGIHDNYRNHDGIFEISENNINGVFHLDFNYIKNNKLFYEGKFYELKEKPKHKITNEFKKRLCETFFKEYV